MSLAASPPTTSEDVDGRDKPDHDGNVRSYTVIVLAGIITP